MRVGATLEVATWKVDAIVGRAGEAIAKDAGNIALEAAVGGNAAGALALALLDASKSAAPETTPANRRGNKREVKNMDLEGMAR